jgi:hypothetical protein
MYAAGESPMKALTSSVTAATRSPKVVLMIFRRLMLRSLLTSLFVSDAVLYPVWTGKKSAKVTFARRKQLKQQNLDC